MRKTLEQRVADTEAAITRWESAGLVDDRRTLFMKDMLARLRSDKGLSTGQRTWLDTLCTESPPAPSCSPELLSRLDSVVQHLSPGAASVLQQFRCKLVSGYTLSEKQKAYMESLLSEGERNALFGKWQPDPEMHATGTFAAQVASTRGSAWRGSHPGTMNAVNRILAGEADERTYRKVIEAMGPAVRELQRPKFSEGDMVMWGALGCLVVSGPVAHEGMPGYVLLTPTGTVTVTGAGLKRVR